MQQIIETIRGFYERHTVVGLRLPDGWFGRAYDNLLTITSIDNVAEEICIEFSGGEKLRVCGTSNVERFENALVITGFTLLEWTWQLYGSTEQKRKVYSAGKVEFLAPPFLKG